MAPGRTLGLATLVLALVACAAPAASPGPTTPGSSPTAAAETDAPTTAPATATSAAETDPPTAEPTVGGASPTGGESSPTAGATAAASPVAACTTEEVQAALKNPGRLTIATDNPAFPPYFQPPAEGEEPASPVNQEDPWALGDPTNKQGFEAAVAWEIADRLGFADDEVDWMYVAWDNLWAPGEKEFDFGLAQISHTDERAQQVDMSEGYYFVNQSLVAPLANPLAEATTMEEIRGYRLGAQIGTTSLRYIEEVIQPTTAASVYQDNTAAIAALAANQIDGIVVDLPTAFFITAVQLPEANLGGEIVGVFPSSDENPEYFSIVLEQDSAMTQCVNAAILEMRSDGTLEAITEEWLTGQADAPIIEP